MRLGHGDYFFRNLKDCFGTYMKHANAIEVSAIRAEKERNLEEAFLSRSQLAERHRTTIETVKRRQAKGLYIAYKLGRHVRYKLSDVIAFESAGRIRALQSPPLVG
jgi:hypothetical protein